MQSIFAAAESDAISIVIPFNKPLPGRCISESLISLPDCRNALYEFGIVHRSGHRLAEERKLAGLRAVNKHTRSMMIVPNYVTYEANGRRGISFWIAVFRQFRQMPMLNSASTTSRKSLPSLLASTAA